MDVKACYEAVFSSVELQRLRTSASLIVFNLDASHDFEISFSSDPQAMPSGYVKLVVESGLLSIPIVMGRWLDNSAIRPHRAEVVAYLILSSAPWKTIDTLKLRGVRDYTLLLECAKSLV
jgi:hypothetical protein